MGGPGALADYACSVGTGRTGPLGEAYKLDGAMIPATTTPTPPNRGGNPPLTVTIDGWRSQTTFSSIRDGLSNTLLVGEKHVLSDGVDFGYFNDPGVGIGN